MKKIFPLLLLCTAIAFTACSSDDDKDEPIAVTSVVLDQSALSIEVGKTATLVATISPKDAVTKEVTWSSSATDVATVADGVVTAVKAGDAIITVTTKDGAKTATCTVKALNYVEVNGLKVAIGNLVANGANGAKIGTATDGGLFFQFGSLIGWSATGDPTVALKPAAFNGKEGWAETGKIWQGTEGTVPFTVKDSGSDNEKAGIGDPCRYYLGDTWRLPTKDEYVALFKDGDYPNGTWKWDATAKSATNSTKNLTFAASGYRSDRDGSLSSVGADGYYWSASPNDASIGYALYFGSSDVLSSVSGPRATGLSVRCVQDASN